MREGGGEGRREREEKGGEEGDVGETQGQPCEGHEQDLNGPLQPTKLDKKNLLRSKLDGRM
jgi:hypothetical protein